MKIHMKLRQWSGRPVLRVKITGDEDVTYKVLQDVMESVVSRLAEARKAQERKGEQ